MFCGYNQSIQSDTEVSMGCKAKLDPVTGSDFKPP